MPNYITLNEVEVAQKEWGKGVVEIGDSFLKKGYVFLEAQKHVTKFYAYKEGIVLFKPTKTSKVQFRSTFESAVSYFVGGNPDFSEDHGFALQPWAKVRFENSGFIFKDNLAFAMGNYFFTDLKGVETKVEYTFGYFRSYGGNLMINIHHSSLPFVPNQE